MPPLVYSPARPTRPACAARARPVVWCASLVWLAVLVLVAPAHGASVPAPVVTDNVTARLLPERDTLAPGDSLDLALVLDIRPHWHTYWQNPGDSGEPTRITWTLPPGVRADPIRWPVPTLIRVGPLANYGYSGRAVHLVTLHIPADWPLDQSVPLIAEAHWLVCEETCIPESGRFTFALDIAPVTGQADPARAGLFAAARAALPALEPVPARLSRSVTALRLQIAAADLPTGVTPAAEIQFFSTHWGLLEHGAPQRVTWADGGLVLDLVPGEAPDRAPPEGLLRVQTGTETRAWPVVAANAAAPPPGLPLALLFAFLGGLLLNLMPCVFPVLAIKALGLARQAGAPLVERAAHGLAYTGGVLAFFGLVGMLLLGLRAGGAAVGWGFQLQSPVFVALLAYLFLVLGLGLAGALTLGTRLMGLGASTGHRGAFVTGALAALVAAPCTAPFMGAALGYAVTLPWAPALLILGTLGLGLAAPFLLLALLPALARRLPRPGAWMETLKQVLAFPLFGTAAWLLWVLTVQTGPDGLAAALAGLLAVTFGLWVLERGRNARRPWARAASALAAVALATALWQAAGLRPAAAPSGSLTGAVAAEPWSAAALAQARAAGRPVFVNMTAAWCITCLVNERLALSGAAVATAFRDRNLLYLKGDWTNRAPAITDYLAGFGRTGVPLYVFYPPGGEPVVLPQVLTEAMVLGALGAP